MNETTDKTLFLLLAGDAAQGPKKRRALGVLGLLFGTLLGVNAVWGLTSPSDTLISALQRAIVPLGWWVALAAIILGGASLLGDATEAF